MSINAADILRQLHDAARQVREGKLDAESALAVSALAGRQVDVMKTVVDFMRVANDPKLADVGGDVFIGTESPRLTHDRS